MRERHHFDGQQLVTATAGVGAWAGILPDRRGRRRPGCCRNRIARLAGPGFHGSMHYMAAPRPEARAPGRAGAGHAERDHGAHGLPAARHGPDWQASGVAALRSPGRRWCRSMRGAATTTRCCAQRLQALADAWRRGGPAGPRVFTDSAPVLEVELATRSGIGWRGKHTLALHREAGSMFFLGEIFVDLALPATRPPAAHCGSCSACIDACPTQAIVAPYRLDARRCISYLTIEHDGPIPEAAAPLRWATASTAATTASWCAPGTSTPSARRCPTSTRARPGRRHAAAAVGLGRGRVPAPHRRQRDPPHRLARWRATWRWRWATRCAPAPDAGHRTGPAREARRRRRLVAEHIDWALRQLR
jgi:epoxyqueuosine reductase